MVVVREQPGQLKGSGAEPWVRNRDKPCLGSAQFCLSIKPEQFVTSLAIPAQLKERKMKPLAIEGCEDTRVGKALPP